MRGVARRVICGDAVTPVSNRRSDFDPEPVSLGLESNDYTGYCGQCAQLRHAPASPASTTFQRLRDIGLLHTEPDGLALCQSDISIVG